MVMCMLGITTGCFLFDAQLARDMYSWAQRWPVGSPERRRQQPGQGPVPTPREPIERLIPDVPLSEQERVLWADLLGAQDPPG
jgi:hypothetical protein